LKGEPGEEVYFGKMWFDTLNQEIVGYSSILDKDKLILSESYTDIISGIKPVELKVVSIDELEIMLNEAISNEDYEAATEIRDKINKLKVAKVS
jgi:excinuclease UvrABC helicase subunit UvrB